MALIIDMEMPRACVWEKASNVLDVCNMIHRCPYAKASAEKRPKGCPIKGEMPDKHGRLAEVDTIITVFDVANSYGGASGINYKSVIDTLQDEVLVPTVVEATE